MTTFLAVAVLVSAAACIGAHVAARPKLYLLLKPATMVLVIAFALLLEPQSIMYRNWIVAGLLLSLAGDVFLMLRDRFLQGLVAFLSAHWCYITAFAGSLDDPPSLPLLLPFLVTGAAVFLFVRPGNRPLQIAVAAYVVSITLMGWLAMARWQETGFAAGPAQLAAAGAILFAISDAVLGTRHFRGDWPTAQPLILGTYFPGQLLIAASLAA